MYTPDKVLVTHDYEGHQSNPVIHTWGRKNAGKETSIREERQAKFDSVDWSFMDHITKLKGTVQPDGVQRINILMEINDTRGYKKATATKPDPEVKRLIDDGRFGIGQARTIKQAYEFAGFSPNDLKMHVNKCGNLKWVPFEDDPKFNEQNDWGVAINLQRRLWNEEAPLLPPPPGPTNGAAAASRSESRTLQAGSGSSNHTFTQGSPLHSLGWIAMLALVLGGFLHRSGILKPKNASKSQ